MRVRTVVAAVVALLLLAGLALGGAAVYFTATRQPAPWSDSCTATVGADSVRIDPEQARYAAIIAGVASRRGLPPRAVSIALATAMQESGLRNLDYGDRDSLGLFQQRPSQGWGTAAQLQDPYYAANAFFAAMEEVKGWETADIGDVAQKVQKSGYPDAYDKHVPKARLLASALSGETPAGFVCTASSLPAGDAAGHAAFLTKTLPTTAVVTTSGSTVTVRTTDAAGAWSAASIAVADAETHGVRSVSVAGRTWRPTSVLWPFGASWGDGASGDAKAVVVELA